MNPYWDILVAVKDKLDAIMVPTSGDPDVDIRYDVSVYDSNVDQLPLIIVAPSPQRFKPGEQQFGGGVWYDYYVDVAWLVDNGRVLKTGLEAYLLLEKRIQTALFAVTLASVSDVWDTEQDDLVVSRVPQTNLRVRGWRFKYRTEETRGGN